MCGMLFFEYGIRKLKRSSARLVLKSILQLDGTIIIQWNIQIDCHDCFHINRKWYRCTFEAELFESKSRDIRKDMNKTRKQINSIKNIFKESKDDFHSQQLISERINTSFILSSDSGRNYTHQLGYHHKIHHMEMISVIRVNNLGLRDKRSIKWLLARPKV